jgi:hypothetical protein
MDLAVATNEKNCLLTEIAAYLDGELKPHEELALEAHVANCKDCLAELNLQKQMLGALDFAFEEKAEIELPENFARVIATRAESGVCGLRSKEERFRALFVCAALFLVILIGLGGETENVLAGLGKFGEQVLAVLSFVGHFIYDFAIGIAIILRSLSRQFVSGSGFSFGLMFVLFMLSAIILSRVVFRFNRS